MSSHHCQRVVGVDCSINPGRSIWVECNNVNLHAWYVSLSLSLITIVSVQISRITKVMTVRDGAPAAHRISCILIMPDGLSWQCGLCRWPSAYFVFYNCTNDAANCTNCAKLRNKTPWYCPTLWSVALPCTTDRCQTVVTICENFRYDGNRGWSGTSCNDTIKLADPENSPLIQKSRNYLL